PLPLARHAPVKVQVLTGLPLGPERGDVLAGRLIEAAGGGPPERGEEHLVVGFGREGQPSAGVRHADAGGPFVTEPFEFAGEAGARGGGAAPADSGGHGRVAAPAVR